MASIAHIIRRRKRRKAYKQERRTRSQMLSLVIVGTLALLILGPVGVVMGSVVSAYGDALGMLPTPEESIALDPIIRPTELYDNTGRVLLVSVEDPQGDERAWISIEDMPTYLVDATLLMEDADFLSVSRFDAFRSLGRFWVNWSEGPSEPDSSLTGRLVRNLIMPTAGDYLSIEDRAVEIALVSEINRLYSPEEILEWHLNTNYYGNQAYGIEAAAQIYLGKSVRDISLDEAALLASIPTAPQYNPINDESSTRTRQSDVLRRLLSSGLITQDQFERASNTYTPILVDAGQAPLIAPDFAIYARQQAQTILNLIGYDGAQMVARGGLRITTTLDLDLYYQSECAMRTHLNRLAGQPIANIQTLSGDICITADFLPASAGTGGDAPPNIGAIVMLDVDTGEILSMVGDTTRERYQPGPTLHPFVYLDAFTTGTTTPASMVLDVYQTFPGAQQGLIYIPNNPDLAFRGPLNLRDAMSMGLLPPVVQIANQQGINNVLNQTVHQIGFPSLSELVFNLSLLERGGAVSVLDMAYLYSVFADNGWINGVVVNPFTTPTPGLRSHDPVAVRRIEDADGQLLWEYTPELAAANHVQRLDEGLAYLVNDILADPVPRRTILGQNNVLEMLRPAAVVNGVTSDGVDNWTIGYTPQIVTAVRLGRENEAMTLSPFAVEGAASVWRAVSEYVHVRNNLPNEEWTLPANIVEQQVCNLSGLAPNGNCPTHAEIFLLGTAPTQPDSYWQSYQVNAQTNQLATSNTPPENLTEQVYFIPPTDAEDWWRANGLPLPPVDYDNTSATASDIFDDVVISQPQSSAYVGGLVDIRGSINDDGMQYYQVVYGEGFAPSEFVDITGRITQYTLGASLGQWDTTGLDGLYSLQIRVVYEDTRLETSNTIQVTVDNIPPTITLTTSELDATYTWGVDQVIPIRAIVQDNILINNVVFYHNGQYFGERNDCHLLPDECGFDFEITRPGVEVFLAIITDAVGNSAEAEITVEIVR